MFKFFLSLIGIQMLSARQMVDEALRHSDGTDVGAYLTVVPNALRKGQDFVMVGPDGESFRLPVTTTGMVQLIALWSTSVDYYRGRQAKTAHADAFVDSNGLLREWNTSNTMAEDWIGIAKDASNGFLAVCRHLGQRSIHKLRAESLAQARREVALTMCFSATPAPQTPLQN